jgi:hypothetical protein
LISLGGIKCSPPLDFFTPPVVRKIYDTTADEELETSCCRDQKDQDIDYQSSGSLPLTPYDEAAMSFSKVSTDFSSLSLENISLANTDSKHAMMYRTLRER